MLVRAEINDRGTGLSGRPHHFLNLTEHFANVSDWSFMFTWACVAKSNKYNFFLPLNHQIYLLGADSSLSNLALIYVHFLLCCFWRHRNMLIWIL